MKRVYQASDLPQAYLLKQLMEDAGIPVKILNESAQGGVGEIPFTHTYPEIWIVRDNDKDKARALLMTFEKNQAREVGETRCPNCKEINPETFETCWNCGQAINP